MAARFLEFNTTPASQPGTGAGPSSIVNGANGDLWITANGSNRLVRINVNNPTPFVSTNLSEAPQSLVFDSRTNTIWYTAQSANRVEQYSPAQDRIIASFSIPQRMNLPSGSHPTGITIDTTGKIWFTEQSGNRIGRIDPATSRLDEFPVPSANGNPFGITLGPDGYIWFTEQQTGKLGRVHPVTGQITEYPIPTPSSYPLGITTGTDGKIWFTELRTDKIGRLDPFTGAFQEFALPRPANVPVGVAAFGPQGITAAPNGIMYFTEAVSGGIGRVNPDGTTQSYKSPSNGRTTSITLGPDGAMWFTNYDANKVGRFTLKDVAADYDGDQKTDLALFRPSTAQWIVKQSSDGILRDPTTGGLPQFGGPNLMDVPITGDFDGDGRTDMGVYRPSTAQWIVKLSSGGVLRDPKTNALPVFGVANLYDIPIPGDYDGDGKTDLAVFRPATSEWLVVKSSGGGIVIDPATGLAPRFGGPDLMDIPIPADFDGDGRTDLAVFRPSTAQWLVKLSAGGVLRDPVTGKVPQFGGPNLMDVPIPGDYDGDGKADLAVFRVSTAQWIVRLSSGPVLRDPATGKIPQFGGANLFDVPVQAPFASMVRLGMFSSGATVRTASAPVSNGAAMKSTVPIALAPPLDTEMVPAGPLLNLNQRKDRRA